MPFKSQKQAALCYSLKSKGKAGSWDCDEWAKKTDFKKLPKKKKTKKKKVAKESFEYKLDAAFGIIK